MEKDITCTMQYINYSLPDGKKMFLDLLEQLDGIHKKGCILASISKSRIRQKSDGKWVLLSPENCYRLGESINPEADYMGWKNQRRAPEYRRACLRGIDYYPTTAGDIYELVYSIYEVLVGSPPQLNFQLNRQWTRPLEDTFLCDSCPKKAALQSLFDLCTQMSEHHRIQTCEQLKETKEFQIIFLDAIGSVNAQ